MPLGVFTCVSLTVVVRCVCCVGSSVVVCACLSTAVCVHMPCLQKWNGMRTRASTAVEVDVHELAALACVYADLQVEPEDIPAQDMGQVCCCYEPCLLSL